jgi:glycosidase
MAVLVPCLVTLRAEFNALNPERDKGADGWIGDAAHQSRPSDHNPDSAGRVHAVDIDSTGPWPDHSFHTYVTNIIADERDKWLDPNDICRLEYVIWDHEIYSRTNDFEPRDYTRSSDPHTNHAHFSARKLDHARADTRPFLENNVANVSASEIASAVWGATFGKETAGERLASIDTAAPQIQASLSAVLVELNDIKQRLTALESKK